MQSSAIATKAEVRYGALRVPAAAVRDVDAAFAYLRQDRVEPPAAIWQL